MQTHGKQLAAYNLPPWVADATCNVHVARYRRQVRTDEKQHTAHAKAATKLLNLALQQGVKEAQVGVNRPGHRCML